MAGFERVRRELIAALQRFKRNCDHTSGLYFTIHALHSPKTTLTLFCPRVQSRRQRSTAIRSSTSKAGATSIWPASCCKRRNHHPSSIGEFERSPLTTAQIEFVPRVFRHSRVSRNPNDLYSIESVLSKNFNASVVKTNPPLWSESLRWSYSSETVVFRIHRSCVRADSGNPPVFLHSHINTYTYTHNLYRITLSSADLTKIYGSTF